MNRDEKLEKSLSFWNSWWGEVFDHESIPRPFYLDKLEKRMQMRQVIILQGIRRSGKSTLMMQLISKLLKDIRPENICFINFDDITLLPLLDSTDFLDELYDKYLEMKSPLGTIFLFFDEIQNYIYWENWIKKMYDKELDVKFIITGSASVLSRTEHSSLLTGRQTRVYVMPLSFKEFLAFNGKEVPSSKDGFSRNRIELKRFLKHYMEFGGFPEVTLIKKDLALIYLKDYFTSILARDILMRHRIRDAKQIEQLAHLSMSNISNLISANKLAGELKSSPHTIIDYLSVLEESYLIFRVPIFSYSYREQMRTPKKIYSIDPGLRNAVGFTFSEDLGRIAENLIFLELTHRSGEVYYWKDKCRREVDFVVKEGANITALYQVCWELTESSKKREITALVSAMEHFKLDEAVIITFDRQGEEMIGDKTIFFIPLWMWLLRD